MDERNLKQKGQSIVLVAAAMVMLVLFVALAVDLSNAYYHRRTAQNAADGAALGAVRQLSFQINSGKKLDKKANVAIGKEMNIFAQLNGIEDTDLVLENEFNDNVDGWYVDQNGNRLTEEPTVGTQVSLPFGTYGVEALTYITAPTYFGGIFGLGGLPLTARAVSLIKQSCSAECVVPIATEKSTICPGGDCFVYLEYPDRCYNIWDGIGTGNFGWLNWSWQHAACANDGSRPCPEVECQGSENDCDVVCLEENLNPNYCASGFIKVGDWASGATGVQNAGPHVYWLDYYYGSRYKDGTEIPLDLQLQPNPFIIVVWDTTSTAVYSTTASCNAMDPDDFGNWATAGLHYSVAGFAKMQLLGYELSNGKTVGHDGVGCTDLGVKPDLPGFRITAKYLAWVEDTSTSGECYDPSGTLLSSPRLTE